MHEFGHALAERAMEHGPKWGEACCIAARMIAIGMADGKVKAH